MDDESLPFDFKSLVNTTMAAYAERLRSKGATKEESESSCTKASQEMFRRSQALVWRVSVEVASMVGCGMDPMIISGYAHAVFAISGVELADEMFNSITAERN